MFRFGEERLDGDLVLLVKEKRKGGYGVGYKIELGKEKFVFGLKLLINV